MRRPPLITRILAIGILLHVYIALRLIPEAPVPDPVRWVAVLYLLASCVLIPLGARARQMAPGWSRQAAWTGLMAMGFFSSLFVLTLLRDLLLLAVWAVGALRGLPADMASLRGTSALAVPALALLITLVGLFNARRLARVVTVDVPIAGLPPALSGFTIAQISDVHVGPTIRRPYVEAIVAAVNALGADVVAVTGDVVDGPVDQLSPHTAPLSGLSGRYGAYLVTGNHEYYSGAREWVAEFERLGLKVLSNRHVVITHNGARLILAGVTDYTAGQFDPGQRSDPRGALLGAPADATVRILLAHQPRTAEAAEPAGYTLQISGHTHGGQFLPWNFFVRLQQPFTAGLKKMGRLWVYTSRGTGYWGPPKRVGAPSEITRIRLVPARGG
ncbi:serine/threonine protein phosphatase [Bordetella genomosp. 8]|uniref:Serine/threonine protein phosphatase n=1 Tax=Bordetella genomosp. 8 TaxID=1416806 RepID=A0A1W6YKK1_9BORD|nr:metallophosphoesterase [Bordetella genomosp. 8]ARP81524.1 serine/threonine protein phosphatase [Bordetella genomosp. 8]